MIHQKQGLTLQRKGQTKTCSHTYVQQFLICSYDQGYGHCKRQVKASHTRYRALDPELIPVYRQSARR